MKKIGLLIAGGIAVLVLFSTVGPMIGLVISLGVLYLAFKKFTKTESTAKKIGWGVIGVIALASAAHNVPAIIGAVAAYVLYKVYKKWTAGKTVLAEENDPFVNFEKQWNSLKQN